MQILVVYDDKYLISCSLDGSICIWKIFNNIDKAVQLAQGFKRFEDILIPFIDLERKNDLIEQLNKKIKDTTDDHKFQLLQIQAQSEKKLEDMKTFFKEVIEAMRDKNLV